MNGIGFGEEGVTSKVQNNQKQCVAMVCNICGKKWQTADKSAPFHGDLSDDHKRDASRVQAGMVEQVPILTGKKICGIAICQNLQFVKICNLSNLQ